VHYTGRQDTGRFGDVQRELMPSGFVHVPAFAVHTPYWLKLDSDVVATGQDDWVSGVWFEQDEAKRDPVIIAQPWGYTKPANQFQELNEWVDRNWDAFYHNGIFQLTAEEFTPAENATCFPCQRIISWCAFFNTEFTRTASGI